jgi:hypothetical protein
MAIPASKDELLGAIEERFDKLIADLDRVPADQARDPSLPGHAKGTVMSPADLVAYLVGWQALVLKWLDRDDRGMQVAFPEEGYSWNELGALAQKFYSDCHTTDWPYLMNRLCTGKAEVVQTINDRSDKELYGVPWYGKWTKGRMIQLNTASPYSNARIRIRKWLRENGV